MQTFQQAILGVTGLKWNHSTVSQPGAPGVVGRALEQNVIRSLCGSKTSQMSRWRRSKCDSAGQALLCKPSCLIDCRATEPSCLSGRQEAFPHLMENTDRSVHVEEGGDRRLIEGIKWKRWIREHQVLFSWRILSTPSVISSSNPLFWNGKEWGGQFWFSAF